MPDCVDSKATKGVSSVADLHKGNMGSCLGRRLKEGGKNEGLCAFFFKIYFHSLKPCISSFVEVIEGWSGYSILTRAPSSVNSALRILKLLSLYFPVTLTGIIIPEYV